MHLHEIPHEKMYECTAFPRVKVAFPPVNHDKNKSFKELIPYIKQAFYFLMLKIFKCTEHSESFIVYICS